MADPVAEKVASIIAAQARRPIQEITPEVSLDSLGLDSLNRVEIVFALEEAFDLSLPFNAQSDAEPGLDLSSVASLVQAVRDQLAAK